MVISKVTKRKRKESSPMPPPAIPVAVVESSPEMPKRTKVQAQRKFALGQNVPSSSSSNFCNGVLVNSTAVVSSTVINNNNTPSTSTEREPPTEILPNKRPKTEDFLTFLCFRGTPTLPEHLNFLKQCHTEKSINIRSAAAAAAGAGGDESVIADTITEPKNHKQINSFDDNIEDKKPQPDKMKCAINNKKNKRNMRKNKNNLTAKQQNLSKRGRPKKTTTTTTTTTTNTIEEEKKNNINRQQSKTAISGTLENKLLTTTTKVENAAVSSIIPFAVRKRAEVIADGNRRAGRLNALLKNTTENVDVGQSQEISQNNNISNQTAEIPQAQKDIGKRTEKNANKNGIAGKKNNKNTANNCLLNKTNNNKKSNLTPTPTTTTPVETKQREKKSSKRKEIPIFIPTTKTMGRMTRQRAFFEPVKVLPSTSSESVSNNLENNLTSSVKNNRKTYLAKKEKAKDLVGSSTKRSKIEEIFENETVAVANKSDLHVFDFSSEDEQPLAESIRLQNKSQPAKSSDKKSAKNQTFERKSTNNVKSKEKIQTNSKNYTAEEKNASPESTGETIQETKNATTIIRKCKKTMGKNIVENDDLKAVAEEVEQRVENKSQRPTRKTKEAAAIYMDIIHHKLQISDDEDDNCSLNSYPDLPNVREIEKMEIQLKKNVSSHKLSRTKAKIQVDNNDIKDKKDIASISMLTRRGRPSKAQPIKSVDDKKNIEEINQQIEFKKTINEENILEENDEDFLLNKELDETKRKLEKNFSDSDDEPLAIKASVKTTLANIIKVTPESNEAQNKNDLKKETFYGSLKTTVQTENTDNLGTQEICNDEQKQQVDQQRGAEHNTKGTAGMKFVKFSGLYGLSEAQQQQQQLQQNITNMSQLSKISTPSQYTQKISGPPPAHFMLPTVSTTQQRHSMPTGHILRGPTPNVHTYTHQYPHPQLHTYMTHLTTQHPHAHAHMQHMHQLPSAHHMHNHGNLIISPHIATTPASSCTLQQGVTAVTTVGSQALTYQKNMEHAVEIYPSSKINPNFLTPKFDRTCLPTTRAASTTSIAGNSNSCAVTKNMLYSPVKYENVAVLSTCTTPNTASSVVSGGFSKSSKNEQKLNLTQATTQASGSSVIAAQQQTQTTIQQTTTLNNSSISTTTTLTNTTQNVALPATNIISTYTAPAVVTSTSCVADPAKDEISSILAANLMPSKEESGKIFGIASVSLAQSSGPDNTKCTLGKCGSIHKPVLGPVVPTEGYFGDQLSSKERRKAKVNMTHEQIQKWLIECSSNPDDIHDELEDDFDENLRPNLYVVSPPPTYLTANGGTNSTSQASKTPTTCTIAIKTSSTALNETDNKLPSTSDNNEGNPLEQEQNALVESPTTSKQARKRNSNGSILISPTGKAHKTEESGSKFSKTEVGDAKHIPIYKKTESVSQKLEEKEKDLLHNYKTYGGAFSVDNEKSIYSFDKDQESEVSKQQPTYRQKNDTKLKDDKEKDIKTISSDAEAQTFYIPLQDPEASNEFFDINSTQADISKVKSVAVQLGHEGANGANQKFVMHASLVTRDQVLQKPCSSETEPTKEDDDKTLKICKKDTALEFEKTSTSKVKSKAATSNLNATALMQTSGNNNNAATKKFKDDKQPKMANNTAFPRHDDPTQMVEAPIFRPTEKEFVDPIDFIERITPIAARFGICKIIPPATFKPECRISDEMRFTAYNQYVHKMLHRWGPSAKELSAIKKYLSTQNIQMSHPPWIGGMEVDLPRLYHTVQELGGLKEVIEKKKWTRVAEEMCIPKLAQDRVTKLDDIYCKYLLPYDTLLPTERQKLFDEVEADWAKREARARRNADRFTNMDSVSNDEDEISSEEDDESDEENDAVSMECIVKGRSMPLSQFYRIARNTMALWFKNTDPTANEIEAEFWRHVAVRDSHVCVHSGSIDSSGWGYGFPSPGPKGKGSNYGRHPWNLKVLTNNPGSVLRSLGPVMGVTVPTLHVGMLFSACCWYRDPHGLSWIEYLHTGASKLWYGIPYGQSANFRSALTSLIPTHCQNKTIWLPCDTVMVPPHMLTDRGVSLCRIEQKPGEFIVVFPRAFTSSVATGYVVSESVYFATSSWLESAHEDFRDMHDSCEPAIFSLEQLLFALGMDQRVPADTLQQMLPMLKEVWEKEAAAREQLKATGVTSNEKIHCGKNSRSKKQQNAPFKSIESECDLCRASLYISMVKTDEGNVYCLQHALKNLNNGNIQAKQCKLIYTYNVEDIKNLIKGLQNRIEQKRCNNGNKKAK